MVAQRSPSPSRVDYASATTWGGTIKMGLAKFFILRVLHDRPMHGYDIARAVERTTVGCCSPTEGTIDPVLRDFEAGAFVTATEEFVQGRRRRVYELTDAGRDRAVSKAAPRQGWALLAAPGLTAVLDDLEVAIAQPDSPV